ncbi:MAG: two-component system sensor histidine kinase CreC [Steroidobacteraceae bacterium]
MRIGLRVLLGYFVIVAIAAILLARVFVQEVKPGVRQAMEDTLVDTANLLAGQARDDLLAGRIDRGRFAASVRELTDRDLGAEIWGFGKRRVSTRIYVTDARGIVVFDSSGADLGKDYSRWNDVYLTLRGRYGARSTRSDPSDDASTVMYVAAPIVDRSAGRDRIVGVLTVARPNQAIAPFIARSQGTILRWGLVLLGTALAVGLLAAWWLSRQLGALRRYADAVTAGERVAPPDAAGEFGDLGRALATMRERLEGKQYVEQYVHALTHELKSPLAAIRGSAELVESGGAAMPADDRARFIATIRAQGDRMAEMIDKLLALAAVEHRQRIEDPQPVELRALAEAATEHLARKLQGRELSVRVTGPAAVAQGDPFLLRQALLNLLDNAADFAPRGSEVEVTITREGPRWTIAVADRGPGVPDYALDRAFERFYSLPRPSGGSRSSGLGLCFVAEVAALHDGRATLGNREGGGAVARLSLPA